MALSQKQVLAECRPAPLRCTNETVQRSGVCFVSMRAHRRKRATMYTSIITQVTRYLKGLLRSTKFFVHSRAYSRKRFRATMYTCIITQVTIYLKGLFRPTNFFVHFSHISEIHCPTFVLKYNESFQVEGINLKKNQITLFCA